MPESDRDPAGLSKLLAELLAVRASLLGLETRLAPRIARSTPCYRESARNLAHYLELRRIDLRPIQRRLTAVGLSSLGRSEAHVLRSLDSVCGVLGRLCRESAPEPEGVGFDEGATLLEAHTEALLGPRPADRAVRILVTMPREAADDPKLVHELVGLGMDAMRINCAHDDAAAWERMLARLRLAEVAHGRRVRVLMDLGGPKLRTGPIDRHSQILHWRPKRDAWGRVAQPARIHLVPIETADPLASDAGPALRVPRGWLKRSAEGDKVVFRDLRGRRRRLRLGPGGPSLRRAELEHGAWIDASQPLRLTAGCGEVNASVHVDPASSGELWLRRGDVLRLTRSLAPGHPPRYSGDGALLEPATIGCTLPEIFQHACPGERISFDDGRIGGVLEAVDEGGVLVRVVDAGARGSRLTADKGINLPDTKTTLPALTARDRRDLDFVAQHADAVGLSFVNSPSDVRELRDELARRGAAHLGIVLKIETRRAFEALPELLFEAMTSPSVGIMIARGDLAVECGYERLAELQEEILWVCEAAHVPVIWATQVLERLAKKGQPSRAEITDAAMGERAECVMLNKGPFLRQAVQTLADILRRMEGHQRKKSPMLRALRLPTGLEG